MNTTEEMLERIVNETEMLKKDFADGINALREDVKNMRVLSEASPSDEEE